MNPESPSTGETSDLAKFPAENPNPILRVRSDGHVMYANAAAAAMMPQWQAEGTRSRWLSVLNRVLASGKQEELEEQFDDRVLNLAFAPVAEGGCVNIYGRDVTARKRAEAELAHQARIDAAMAELSQAMIRPSSIEELSEAVLHHAKELTGSKFGYVGYINATTGYLVCPTLSIDIWDKCEVPDKSIVFKKFTGLWGWVLNNRKPLVANDPSGDPRSSGTPPGHISIERFISTPAVHGADLLGQIALANADRDYTEADLAILDRLAAMFALAVQRKRTTDALHLSYNFLEIANRHLAMPSLLDQFVRELREFSGCACVGIRILTEDGHIPYESHDGFDQEFYGSESNLSVHMDRCMCINVITGKTDPSLPYYTRGGSFYMNATTRFLASLSPQQRAQTRNVCNEWGYESVALIPIRAGETLLGLIHLADTRENAVPLSMVEVLEGVGMQLGTAVQRVRAEEGLREAKDKLEVRVRQRTADLVEAVERLEDEVRDRLRAERALVEQSKVLEAFFSHTITPLVFLDRNFNFIRVNEAYARACKKEVADFVGRNHFDMYPSDAKQIFDDVVRTKQPYMTIARPFVYPDQPERGVTYWDWTLVPILDEEGEVSILVFSLQDVTERKRAEQAVEDERRRLFSVLNVLPGYVCLVAGDHTIRFANETFVDIFGRPENRRCYEILHHRDKPCRHCPTFQVLRTGRSQEWENHGLNGQTYHVLGYPFADIDGTETVLQLGVDITERKELEKEVISACDAVRRSIGRDLHDSLGQNLTGLAFLVQGFAHRLKKQFPEEVTAADQIIGVVNESVSQVRSLARGLAPVGLQEGGLAAGLHELASNVAHIFGVSCKVNCDEPIAVNDNVAEHLYHIAQESVNNAIRHGRARSIDITLDGKSDAISLVIKDNGVGFNPDEVLRRNKGMGMHIMRYRASAIGGTLSVMPRQQGGTVVSCSVRGIRSPQTD